MLLDEEVEMMSQGFPIPPDVSRKIRDALKSTEQYAQQAEKLINGDLKAKDKK